MIHPALSLFLWILACAPKQVEFVEPDLSPARPPPEHLDPLTFQLGLIMRRR
jgi:hypothetical protein